MVVEVPLEDNRAASRPGRRAPARRSATCIASTAPPCGRWWSAAGLEVVEELADPLPRQVHAFFAAGALARAKALAKAAARRALFTAAPQAAERAFTVHYACLCLA